MHSFRLTYDSRKIKAVLTIQQLEEPVEVTAEEVFKYLEEAGIVKGLDTEAVEKMVEEKKWDTPVLVAKGVEPVNGEDGSIEFFFDSNPDHTPRVRSDGSVDFHNINITAQVHVGQTLAQVIPPTAGTPGEDVFGVTMLTRAGKEARIIPGANTSFTDGTRTLLKSNVNGHAEVSRDGSVQVVQVFTVRGDVDYSTGDIEFDGDLEIMGDVKSGFTLKTTGNIEIMGTVEDATIEAQGKVMVRGGYIGSGRGSIQVGTDAIFRFVRNQQVIAERDIYIYEESMHSQLSAGRAIIMNKGRGQIVGGFAEAGRYAEINVIGNDKNIQTRISICEESSLSLKIESLRQKMERLLGNYDKLVPALEDMRKRKKDGTLSKEMQETHNQMEQAYSDLTASIESTSQVFTTHQSQMQHRRMGMYVRAQEKVYPGVLISIAGSFQRIETLLGPSLYMLGGKDIIIKMAERKERK